MQNSDIILLIPLAWGLGWGLYKGLISQVTSLIGIVIVIYVSCKYYGAVANLLNAHIESRLSETYISIASFVILFVLLFLLIYFVSKQIEKLIKALQMGFLNHLAGGLFGLIKWALIVSVLIALINKFGEEIHVTLIDFHDTWIYNHLEMIAPKVMPNLLRR